MNIASIIITTNRIAISACPALESWQIKDRINLTPFKYFTAQ